MAKPNGTYPLGSNSIKYLFICSYEKSVAGEQHNKMHPDFTAFSLSPCKICKISRTAGKIVVHGSLKNSRVLSWIETAPDHWGGQLKDLAASLRGSAASPLSLYKKKRMLASQISLCSAFCLPSKSRMSFNMRMTTLVEIMA